jgi:hypothetical protein
MYLAGCTKKKVETPVDTFKGKFLVITAEPGMNNNTAVIVDIVQAQDEYVWNQLLKMSAAEYFKRRNDIINKKMNVWSIDVLDKFWVEGFQLKDYDPNCAGVMLFANYSNADSKTRCQLNTTCDCTRITLGRDNITQAESVNRALSDARMIQKRIKDAIS